MMMVGNRMNVHSNAPVPHAARLASELSLHDAGSPPTFKVQSPTTPLAPASLARKTTLAMCELALSERKFVDQLDRLVNVYLPRLPLAFNPSLSLLIRNAPALLELHTRLATRLWDSAHSRPALCQVLISHAPELASLYAKFCAGHPAALALLNHVQARIPQTWATWERERADEGSPENDRGRPLALQDLMIAPIQRVCRYCFLVANLRDGTEEEDVMAAMRAMQTVASVVDEITCTNIVLERMDPIPNQPLGFLAKFGPCVLIGSLDATYYATAPPPFTIPYSQPHSLPTRRKPTKPKHLAAFLWMGYLVLCKVRIKRCRYEPKHWFPLKIVPNTSSLILDDESIYAGGGVSYSDTSDGSPWSPEAALPGDSPQPSPQLASYSTITPNMYGPGHVNIVASDELFPYGIRIAFGRHVFELGAACVEERDLWVEKLTAARIRHGAPESGQVTQPMVDGGRDMSFDGGKIKGRMWITLPERNRERDVLVGSGETVRRGEGRIPVRTVVEQLPKDSYKTLTRATGSRNYLAPPRAAKASYMSSSEVFKQLVDRGCADLSSTIDPHGYSSHSITGGGYGDIWKGRMIDGTPIAIKVWRLPYMPRDDLKHLKRAMREVYNWSKVEHENVHKLMGVVMLHGRLGMVSLWMEHGSLRDYLGRNPDVDRRKLCVQVVKGLRHLHNKDMVHGDLKAANILVSHDGILKLSDFDHSILSECSLLFSDTTNAGGGTLRWMAPELLLSLEERGGSSSRRSKQSDIYALGMTFLEIISGQVPYNEYPNDVGVYRALDKRKLPVRPKALSDGRMWTLLVNCWDHEPSKRLSANEVLVLLEMIVR